VRRFRDRTRPRKHPHFDLPHTLRTNPKLPRDCREGKSRASELCHLALTYCSRESLVCVHEINFRRAELALLLGFPPRREFSTVLLLRLWWGAYLSTSDNICNVITLSRIRCKHVVGECRERASSNADFGSASIFRSDSETPAPSETGTIAGSPDRFRAFSPRSKRAFFIND
jgi:hypothetical protein